ncbi:MAG: MoaD/ThiS family protein [Anaerolineae bacterium]|nr:MoaD/ThiS family protein [Anaerolineae bacterium]
MGVRVRFPGAFRLKIGGVSEVTVDVDPDGDTVLHVLQRLAGRFPELAETLCDQDGRFRPTMQIYVNDEHVRFRQGLQTVVSYNDLVYIVPIVMGG